VVRSRLHIDPRKNPTDGADAPIATQGKMRTKSSRFLYDDSDDELSPEAEAVVSLHSVYFYVLEACLNAVPFFSVQLHDYLLIKSFRSENLDVRITQKNEFPSRAHSLRLCYTLSRCLLSVQTWNKT